MPSEYDEPTAPPSGYGSMRSTTYQYKASQLRRTPTFAHTKSIRGSGSIFTERRNITIYFVFIIVIISLNFAMSVYLIIAEETRNSYPLCKIKDGMKAESTKNEPDIEQVISSVNTMLHALTYTLPQVLNNNRHAILTRMNHLIYEMKEIVKLNNIDFNVRFNTNKSVILRTGQQSKNLKDSPSVQPPTTSSWLLKPITIIPRKNPFTSDNLPFTKLPGKSQLSSKVRNVKNLNIRHRDDQRSRDEDYALFNPII